MPFNNFKLLREGFTLIEVLISISLIAVVTAVAIPNLRQFNKGRELDEATDKLFVVLKAAQSSAGSNIKCPSGVSSTGWRVDFSITSGVDNYYLFALCPSPTTEQLLANSFTSGASGGTSFQAVTDLCGANVNASVLFTNRQVAFYCNGILQANAASMKVTLSSSSGFKSVVVQNGGVIRIE